MAIDLLLQDDITSATADDARRAVSGLKTWLLKEESKEAMDSFINWLRDRLVSIVSCLTNKKRFCAGREKMWTSFHAFRISDEFLDRWRGLFRHFSSITVSPIVFQRLTSIMFKSLLHRRTEIIRTEDSHTDGEPLSTMEENAMRYAAGYVCKQVAKKFRTSKQQELVFSMELLQKDSDDEDVSEQSSIWIESIDRGGLWQIKNNVYSVFYAMEEEVRSLLKSKSSRSETINFELKTL